MKNSASVKRDLILDELCVSARIDEKFSWFFELIITEIGHQLGDLDWCIPNWRNAENYYQLRSYLNSDSDWRWEFLRRNDLYRLFWKYQTDDSLNFKTKTFIGYETTKLILLNVFGLWNFPDPRLSAIEFGSLTPANPAWATHPTFNVVSHDVLKFSDKYYDDLIYTDHEILRNRIENGDGPTVYVAIDPRRKIDIQLSKAAEWFKSDPTVSLLQKSLHDQKVLVKRSTRNKWERYLRLLDARESGASWSEMAVLLDGKKAQPEQSARNTWNLAARVRREFCCTI